MQDYLKAIYLSGGTDGIGASELAGALGVKAASVTGMLRRLAAQKLVTYSPYQRVGLSPEGKRAALEVVRHHRLLELYLRDVLGYPLDQIHEEADALEHVISEVFEERIDLALGRPSVDPHGEPIPGLDGSIAPLPGAAMGSLRPGDAGVVLRVVSAEKDKLDYLEGIGFTAGARIRLEERKPFGGPLVFRVGPRRRESMAQELADCVRVRREP
jgi:DtxR family Mn-dependent transcriptional regulator